MENEKRLLIALQQIRDIVPENPKLPICHEINTVLYSVNDLITNQPTNR